MLGADGKDRGEIACPSGILESIQLVGRQGIVRADDNRRPPLPLFQGTQPDRHRPVLVPLARFPDLHERAPVGQLQPGKERHVGKVIPRIILPSCRQHLLGHVVAPDHDRPVRLHVRCRDIQLPCGAHAVLGLHPIATQNQYKNKEYFFTHI